MTSLLYSLAMFYERYSLLYRTMSLSMLRIWVKVNAAGQGIWPAT